MVEAAKQTDCSRADGDSGYHGSGVDDCAVSNDEMSGVATHELVYDACYRGCDGNRAYGARSLGVWRYDVSAAGPHCDGQSGGGIRQVVLVLRIEAGYVMTQGDGH